MKPLKATKDMTFDEWWAQWVDNLTGENGMEIPPEVGDVMKASAFTAWHVAMTVAWMKLREVGKEIAAANHDAANESRARLRYERGEDDDG